jgi:hypothetical protein
MAAELGEVGVHLVSQAAAVPLRWMVADSPAPSQQEAVALEALGAEQLEL